MSKLFALLGIALLAACAVWLWLALRRYAARKQREHERATAFMAEAIEAAKKPEGKADTP